jgi:hypothetical protein
VQLYIVATSTCESSSTHTLFRIVHYLLHREEVLIFLTLTHKHESGIKKILKLNATPELDITAREWTIIILL